MILEDDTSCSRIGFLSCFSEWHTEPEIAYWLREAGLGVDCWHYNRTDREAFLAREYDMVLTSLPQLFPPEFWRALSRRTMLVAWFFDWIREWERERQYVPALREFDLVLSTDGFDGSWYAERGVERQWLPHACDTRFFHPAPGRDEYQCDVAFVGHTRDYPARQKLFRRLRREFNFRHYGERSDVYGTEHAVICNSAKVMVADNYVNDVPGYWSDRVYLEVGSGGCVIHPRVPGIEGFFREGDHLLLWDSPDDLIEKIRTCLADDDLREHIQRNGWKHVHQNHSQKHRIKEFLELCGLTSVAAPF